MRKTIIYSISVIGLVSLALVFGVSSSRAVGPNVPLDQVPIHKREALEAQERARMYMGPLERPVPRPHTPQAPVESRLVAVQGDNVMLPMPRLEQKRYEFTTAFFGGYNQVYAGTLTSDVRQGILYVIEFDPNTSESSTEIRQTPERAGAVTITRWDGEKLFFRTASGSTGQYDLTTQQFR